jgi:hypothetical protein
VAERGAGAAGENARGGELDAGPRRLSDGVDAWMDAMKAAELEPAVDRVVVRAESEELFPGDVAVLPSGKAAMAWSTEGNALTSVGNTCRYSVVISHPPYEDGTDNAPRARHLTVL